ncbi:hypothetical protein [Sphingopyxis panaciterrae]
MIAVRSIAITLLTCALGGCAAHSPPGVDADRSADVPADLAVNRSWSSNAGGYIFSVGYFTPEQLLSEAWENKRLESRQMAKLCDSEHLAHRDVRWFEPIAPGEPRCAIVVYSFACSPKRPEWGSSLEYERQQALLDEPDTPPPLGCGEKSRSKLPIPLNQTPAPRDVILSEHADCKRMPDMQAGKFRLRDVNYVNARTLVSPSFVRSVYHPYPDPVQNVSLAASREQKVHLVTVKRVLPDDGNNLFIEQSFASDGQGFCATLTARQGANMWRKTMRADLSASAAGPNGKSAKPLDQYMVAEALQQDLAAHMGFKIFKARKSGGKD